jgi:hypothetical protein
MTNPNSEIPFWVLSKVESKFFSSLKKRRILINNKLITLPDNFYRFLFKHARITSDSDMDPCDVVWEIDVEKLKKCKSKKVRVLCANALIKDFNQVRMECRVKKTEAEPWILLQVKRGDLTQRVTI